MIDKKLLEKLDQVDEKQLDAIQKILYDDKEQEEVKEAFLPGAMVAIRLGDIKVPTICTGAPSYRFDSFFRLEKSEKEDLKLVDNYIILVMGGDNKFREYYTNEPISVLNSENDFDEEYGSNAVLDAKDFYQKFKILHFNNPITLYTTKYHIIDDKTKQLIGNNEGKEEDIANYIYSLEISALNNMDMKMDKLEANDRKVAYTENIIYDIEKKKKKTF